MIELKIVCNNADNISSEEDLRPITDKTTSVAAPFVSLHLIHHLRRTCNAMDRTHRDDD